jgi:hypothetical protein
MCVGNRGYRASLVLRKVYKALPDAAASKRSLLRVIDESGEDYLYPAKFFVAVELPKAVGRLFTVAT